MLRTNPHGKSHDGRLRMQSHCRLESMTETAERRAVRHLSGGRAMASNQPQLRVNTSTHKQARSSFINGRGR